MILVPGTLNLTQLNRIFLAFEPFSLPDSVWPRVEAGAKTVQEFVAKGVPAYGINTGFGKLSKIHIPSSDLQKLQVNLVRSHSVGVGAPLQDDIVRLTFALKIASLARGYSGVRRSTIETALQILNNEIYPVIPCQGSVGASGDLAPLAHLTLTIMGEGNARVAGHIVSSRNALEQAGIAPVQLAAKEGLAFLNGTQVSNAIALAGLFEAQQCLGAAVLAGGLCLDAAKGSDTPFDPRIHELRGQTGQIRVARAYKVLLEGSKIRASHLVEDDRVQDPYSLRCQPQVMGACLDVFEQCARTLWREANAVTDNPLVLPETGEVLSGGNFHAEPVALAADSLAIALAEVGAISERRIALLIDPTLSGLPPFLAREPGINSGFMIAHVTAAALASENKTLAHPASVDSLPTSANQEDHVSMATFAARKLRMIAQNVRTIIAIELMVAADGIDFHRPLQSSKMLEQVHKTIRQAVPAHHEDRVLAGEIELLSQMIATDSFSPFVAQLGLSPDREGA